MTTTELRKHDSHSLDRTEGTRDRPVVSPRTDIFETGDNIVLSADMPGVDESNVGITLEKNVLTIEGTAMVDERPGHELGYSEAAPRDFRRSFTLSDEINRNKISASVKHGVLRLVLPKAEPAKARRIKVNAG